MKKTNCLMITLVCYFAYVSIYIARLNLSMASPGLIAGSVMNEAQIGFLGSIFSVVYAVGRLINGGLGDKKSPWIMISTGLLFVAIANGIIGVFPPYIVIMILWGINAFAQSMLWSSILKVTSSIYDAAKAKKVTPYMVTSVAAGNIVGIILNTYLINHFGIRYAFIVPGGLALAFCILTVLTVKNIDTIKAKTEQKSIFRVLLDKKVRMSIAPAMFHGVMKDNISLWMAVYIVDRFGVNLKESAYFVLLVPVIGFVGRFIYPWLYKLCSFRAHKVSQIGFVLCTVACLPLIFGAGSAFMAALCLSIIYASVSLINTTFLSIFPMEFLKSDNVSSVSGIMDFATYLGAGIGSAVYGVVISRFGYSPMFISWGIISVLSVFLIIPLVEKKENI